MTTQTTPFTATELAAIRRYCGYPAYASFGYVLAPEMATLDTQCASMSDAEQAIVRTSFLPSLATLETAIDNATVNMGTASAAVWTRNKNELQERIQQYTFKRLEFCQFIGCAPGDRLKSTSGGVRRT